MSSASSSFNPAIHKTKWVMTYGRREVVKQGPLNPAIEHYGWRDLCNKEAKDIERSVNGGGVGGGSSGSVVGSDGGVGSAEDEPRPPRYDSKVALNPGSAPVTKWGWKDGRRVFLGGEF